MYLFRIYCCSIFQYPIDSYPKYIQLYFLNKIFNFDTLVIYRYFWKIQKKSSLKTIIVPEFEYRCSATLCRDIFCFMSGWRFISKQTTSKGIIFIPPDFWLECKLSKYVPIHTHTTLVIVIEKRWDVQGLHEREEGRRAWTSRCTMGQKSKKYSKTAYFSILKNLYIGAKIPKLLKSTEFSFWWICELLAQCAPRRGACLDLFDPMIGSQGWADAFYEILKLSSQLRMQKDRKLKMLKV